MRTYLAREECSFFMRIKKIILCSFVIVFGALLFSSCQTAAPEKKKTITGKYWQLQIPEIWTVQKARNGYQLSSDELPGIIQISSHRFRDVKTLQYFVKNLPEIFIVKQNIVITSDKKYVNGNYKGIYFEYLDEQKLNNIAWAMMNKNIIIYVSYLSDHAISPKDKAKIEKLVRQIQGC
ncbi:MAG: hypothetical protein GY750_09475 [Lentisphaerae bacterium]|nr:hypothetical protein [Lentisphaerota bacterium]MCP4101642.1 hypothetical protein [Lentisphaerota bacterium]